MSVRPFIACLLIATAALAGPATTPVQPVQVDPQSRRVMIPATVAKQNVYEQLQGAIEYIACCPGGKEYEALFICPVSPSEVREALLKIGLLPGEAAGQRDGQRIEPRGSLLRITVQWTDGNQSRSAGVETFVLDKGQPMAATPWVFTGSRHVQDPASGKDVLEASLLKNLISLHQLEAGILIQNPVPGANESGRYKTNTKALPKEGTAVTLVLEAVAVQRVHLFVSGQVQGVGFRAFTQRAALPLGVRGWVRNLPDGRVEILAEGDAAAIEQFQAKVRQGPRGSRVDKVESAADTNEALGPFEIRETPEK